MVVDSVCWFDLNNLMLVTSYSKGCNIRLTEKLLRNN